MVQWLVYMLLPCNKWDSFANTKVGWANYVTELGYLLEARLLPALGYSCMRPRVGSAGAVGAAQSAS